MTVSPPPSYHLFRPICAVCSKPSGGLVLSKGCNRADHDAEYALDAPDDHSEHCDDEALWPCSQACAEKLVSERHGILVLETSL